MLMYPKARSVALGATGSIICFLLTATGHAQEFSYNGDDGPAYWHELNSAWSACADDGMMQSPINIDRIRLDWRLRPLELRTYPTTIDIFNNGHTIEQRYEDTGSSVYWEGVDYELKQFHFHTLSEHTVGGRHGVMEMHGVFAEPGGTNLVIGQLFYIGDRKSRFIQKLIDAGLPPKSASGDTVSNELIDFADGLGDTRSYFTYQGSLTTPPCSEVVTWVVLKRPVTITAEQLDAFRRILGNNFRPIQDTHGREVRATGHGERHWSDDHHGH